MQSFSDEILELIDDRIQMMFEIERVLFSRRYKLSRNHLSIFSIQSVSMIYAIWEGFVQQSFQKYISYINSKNLDFAKLSNEIKVFHMENTFKQLTQYPQKNSFKVKFYDSLGVFYRQTHQDIYPQINTGSNVGWEELNTILTAFCLEPFPNHWEKYKHPNPNLKETMKTFLRYRNGVAHGGDISSEEKVTQAVYTKYKKLVSNLMDAIHEKMIDGITKETYLQEHHRSSESEFSS